MEKFFKTILICGLMLLLPIVLIGCGDDDDDESRIKICNTDDEEYDVQLYQSDNTLADEFTLEKYYKDDACDKFSDPAEGRYYIKITEVGNSDNIDTTSTFYMESGDQKYFKIKSPGRISGDDSEGTTGTVEVCNSDDEEYDVQLYQASDDSLVAEIHLEEYYNLDDVCDDFSNVVTGEYYIFISEDGADNTNTSDTFYLDGGETEIFLIESPGTIEKE